MASLQFHPILHDTEAVWSSCLKIVSASRIRRPSIAPFFKLADGVCGSAATFTKSLATFETDERVPARE